MSSPTHSNLEQFANDAVAKHAKSHVEMAMEFTSKACPAFGTQDNDRLVKVGRSLENLVFLSKREDGAKIPLGASLEQLVEECTLLCSGDVKVSPILEGCVSLEWLVRWLHMDREVCSEALQDCWI